MSKESLNPYQANLPVDDVPDSYSSTGSSKKLFSAFSVVLATFLGSLASGAILMAINYRRLGRTGEAIATLVAGCLATAALMLCTMMFLPDSIPSLCYTGLQALLGWAIFQQLQGQVVKSHQSAGGKMASAWWTVPIAVLVSLPLLGIGFGIDAAYQMSLGRRISIGRDEVYISGSATEDDGRWLAAKLQEAEWFGGDGAGAVIHRSGSKYTISLFVAYESTSDQETIQFLTDFGEHLADERLGHPLEMRLMDESYSVKQEVPIP